MFTLSVTPAITDWMAAQGAINCRVDLVMMCISLLTMVVR